MGRVIIGMDPHKRSATVEIINDREKVLTQGRFGTDREGYLAMLSLGRQHKDRVWAVEGCNGIGRHIGQGRKTDPVDAHSVAVVALRTNGLHQVSVEDTTVALRLLVDRRDVLGRARTDTINRLHQQLLELVPGGAKTFLSAQQARALLNTVRPRDIVGRTRRQRAAELITELTGIDKKIKAANTQLTELVAATGSTLLQLNGIGPSGAARLLGDIGDIGRFASRGHFASWNGTAPIDASSGDQQRHRLSRAGNRRINRVLHIMAIVQLRNDTEGRAYYRRKLAAGKTPMEAIRALKRRLSNIVYQQMINDTRHATTGPGGQRGATLQSSAASPIPTASTSDQSLPGPATTHSRTPALSAP